MENEDLKLTFKDVTLKQDDEGKYYEVLFEVINERGGEVALKADGAFVDDEKLSVGTFEMNKLFMESDEEKSDVVLTIRETDYANLPKIKGKMKLSLVVYTNRNDERNVYETTFDIERKNK